MPTTNEFSKKSISSEWTNKFINENNSGSNGKGTPLTLAKLDELIDLTFNHTKSVAKKAKSAAKKRK